MNWQDHIVHDPAICHGRATLMGTRVMVSVVLDNLAAGLTVDELRKHYPNVSPDAVQACLGYAAALAKDEIVTLPEPTAA